MVEFERFFLEFEHDTRSASLARRAIAERLRASEMDDVAATAGLVVTELVANAVLHTEGPVGLEVAPLPRGLRITVTDASPVMPLVANASTSAMTGRGLLLVRSLAARMGFEPTAGGKAVWAEVEEERAPAELDEHQLIEAWADDLSDAGAGDAGTLHIELGEVPTDLLLAAKAHVDNLVREFTLAASGADAGATASVPPHLARLIETVVHDFADARLSIKRQALDGSRRGLRDVHLELHLRPGSAAAGEAYLRALDEADVYCRAARLLTLETPPEHRVFRQWYVGEILTQLRRADAGLPPEPPQRFEDRLLQEIHAVAAAWAAADRAARLASLSTALAGAVTSEAVADAVLSEGVGALRASGGGLVMAADHEDRLIVTGTVGYDDALVRSLREESPAAELPAAVVLRTGAPVWIESKEERDRRFPDLVDFERDTVSMCAVPLRVGERLLGALRFSFSEQRLFDDDERRFALSLASLAAQAIDRARLYEEQAALSRRLQRILLPPVLPSIPRVSIAAVHHPLSDGMGVGGDFYDVWPLGPDEWAFALGDVCGKGPGAAALTALVRYSLRALAGPTPNHVGILERLNALLLSSDDSAEQFCTAVFGTLRHSGEGVEMVVATGGHPGPLIERADGAISVLDTAGTLLGAVEAVTVGTEKVRLASGDRALFYTDGATEARNGQEVFGTDGLVSALRAATGAATGAAAAIEDAIVRFSDGRLTDDLAVLLFTVD